ncbi:MAG: hypothetical protein ACFFBD_13000 [Candidatus Hodarchaeota archaeon]
MAPPTIYLYFALTLLRIICLVVFIDFYFKLKHQRFKILIFGWFIYILSPICAILSFIPPEGALAQLLYLFYGILASVGAFYIMLGFVMYFRNIHFIVYSSVGLALLIVPIVLSFFFPQEIAMGFALFAQFLVIVVAMFFVVKHRKLIKTAAGNSYYWVVAIVLVASLNVLAYAIFFVERTFYQTNELFPYGLGFTIGTSAVITLFFLNFEHNVSLKAKELLKDKYSHNLANILQNVLGNIDLALTSQLSDEEVQTSLNEAKENSIKAKNLIFQIRNL